MLLRAYALVRHNAHALVGRAAYSPRAGRSIDIFIFDGLDAIGLWARWRSLAAAVLDRDIGVGRIAAALIAAGIAIPAAVSEAIAGIGARIVGAGIVIVEI